MIMRYAKLADVTRYLQVLGDDPNLNRFQHYWRFALWLRSQGMAECQRLDTFSNYLCRVRKIARLPTLTSAARH